jgi:hypothetical protein
MDKDKDDDTMQLNFRGTVIKINKSKLLNYDDFFLKNMILDLDCQDDEIFIDEDYEYARCILNSMDSNALLIDKNLDYLGVFILADKWCCPDWLLNELDKHINRDISLENFKDLIMNIYQCKICKSGFKLNENHAKACHFHPGQTSVGTYTWTCCGQSYVNNSNDNSKHNIVIGPCTHGYHVAEMSILEQNHKLEIFKKIKTIENEK